MLRLESRSRNYFNPRPPRGGRRRHLKSCRYPHRFQSTPPARGATSSPSSRWSTVPNFNPRPPRGGRPPWDSAASPSASNFNPRPPRGGRRCSPCRVHPNTNISIHAPREGGDVIPLRIPKMQGDFNPRPPRGGRRRLHRQRRCRHSSFQSTPPARGATQRRGIQRRILRISIHAPREGGD